MRRKFSILFVLIVFTFTLIYPSDKDELAKFFVKVDGFSCGAPVVSITKYGSFSNVYAEYKCESLDKKEFVLKIKTGKEASLLWAHLVSFAEESAGETVREIKKLSGFNSCFEYDGNNIFVAILIIPPALYPEKTALLLFDFKNVEKSDALNIIKKFDLKKLLYTLNKII